MMRRPGGVAAGDARFAKLLENSGIDVKDFVDAILERRAQNATVLESLEDSDTGEFDVASLARAGERPTAGAGAGPVRCVPCGAWSPWRAPRGLSRPVAQQPRRHAARESPRPGQQQAPRRAALRPA